MKEEGSATRWLLAARTVLIAFSCLRTHPFTADGKGQAQIYGGRLDMSSESNSIPIRESSSVKFRTSSPRQFFRAFTSRLLVPHQTKLQSHLQEHRWSLFLRMMWPLSKSFQFLRGSAGSFTGRHLFLISCFLLRRAEDEANTSFRQKTVYQGVRQRCA